jgi:hypothetical protein
MLSAKWALNLMIAVQSCHVKSDSSPVCSILFVHPQD